ncbi:hypothetical protein V1L52_05820 [Treponema sp. HNW]|uniref:hypothetical protein n=1 Tax=Treponema sp. HNW TaxID=3116654 RepID=UPI003D10EB84
MNKKEVYKTGICIMGCLFIAFLLILLYLPAEKYKAKKIAEEINTFLDKNGKSGYKVGEAFVIKSPIQSGVLIFKLADASGKPAGLVCLVRITGICGPVPALFICDKQKNIEFAGSFFEDGRLTDMQIAYWITHLRTLTENTEQ